MGWTLKFIISFSIILISKNIVFAFSFPPDTIPDTIKKNQIDTVKIKNIVYVYDTVKVFDTIIKYVNQVSIENYYNSLVFSVGGGLTKNQISSNDKKEIIDLIQSSETNKFSPEINIGYCRKKGKWQGQVGVNFLLINQFADYNIKRTDIQENMRIDSLDNSYWQVVVVDTFYEVNGTDSVMQIVADSTWMNVYQIDTVTTYDTLTNEQSYKGKNKYSYVRIPLVVRYAFFENEKWRMNAGVGFIVGFLTQIKGQTLTENYTIQPLEELLPLRTNLFFHGEFGLTYKLTKRIHPFVRITGELMLKPLFPEKNIERKLPYLAIKTGLLINF